MDTGTLRVIASAAGRRRIDDVAADLADGIDALTLLSRLRAEHSPPVARAILNQAQLRKKAIAKLGTRAAGLLLLQDSLEQASRAEVADARARRLVAAGVHSLTDAGAGLGADSLAYAAAGLQVRAIEHDPLIAAVLRENLRDSGVEALEGDALALLPDDGVVYFDPARRADGRRLFDPERCSPPLSTLVATHQSGLPVVAKMSPSLAPADVPPGWSADWVSTQTEQGRSVVECTLWSPPLGDGQRCAVVLADGAEHRLVSASAAAPPVGDIKRYLYEPDGAVNQAEVVGELASALDATLLEPRIAYLSSDTPTHTPFAHRYEVLETMRWSKRAVARALASYDASDLVIKKRGITVDPTALRTELLPRLRSRNGPPLTIVLTPHRGTRLALFTRA